MGRSITFAALLMALASLAPPGCNDEAMTCSYDLACANQEGLIGHCCLEEGENQWLCFYETPDGKTFTCDPIEDPVNAGPYCEQAIADMTAHCSE